MKKSDLLTPFGIIAGIIMLIIGIASNGGISDIFSFFDPTSILIVVGGLTAALFVSFPLKDLSKLFAVMKQSFSQEEEDFISTIKIFIKLADRARREGLLSLEVMMQEVNDPHIRKGIILAVDGNESGMIRDIMEAEIVALEERHRKGRTLIEKAGEYAPAWGMIGTLIGLVLMLKNLNDPGSLGPNMAIAILTTLYGALLANLVFIPMANKLLVKTEAEVFKRQLIIEGVLGVQAGQNPRILEQKLIAFLSYDEQVAAGKKLYAPEEEEDDKDHA